MCEDLLGVGEGQGPVAECFKDVGVVLGVHGVVGVVGGELGEVVYVVLDDEDDCAEDRVGVGGEVQGLAELEVLGLGEVEGGGEWPLEELRPNAFFFLKLLIIRLLLME